MFWRKECSKMEIGWQNEGCYYFVRTKRYFPSEKTQVSSEENRARLRKKKWIHTLVVANASVHIG